MNEPLPVVDSIETVERPSNWVRPARHHVLALLLIALTLALFWPATRHSFMMIDDSDYVTDHPLVSNGLSWTGVGYAFVARHSGNWHPLTTISHMVDCQLFGLNPFGHHFVNILLHALNAAVLFGLIRALTGSLWRAFFIAAFFALHPLRVESVAWISERKDVLCAFFYLLTLWAYSRHVRTRNQISVGPSLSGLLHSKFYLLSLLFFSLALLAKPMAVTLPFVLLLLDYWPLQRFQISFATFRGAKGRQFLWGLLSEKMPFFVLTLIDSYITTQVQQRAMAQLETLPIADRVANMFLSYSQYISKTFLPEFLAVVYPHRNPSLASLEVVVAIVLIGAFSLVAWHGRQRMPWILVGWCWFLGTLIPVIGLVQVGIQSYADRYTYLPCIGLVFFVVWMLGGLAGTNTSASPAGGVNSGGTSWLRRLLPVIAIVALAGLATKTRAQLTHWQTNNQLFSHTLRTAGDSELVRHCLGYLALSEGRLEHAAHEFRAGLRLHGDAGPSMLGLAAVYSLQDKPEKAEVLYRKALELQPSATAHFQLADFLAAKDRLDEGRIHYLQGLAMAPYQAASRIALGNLYVKQANWTAAREEFERALKSNPKLPDAHVGLADVFTALGQDDNAVFHLRAAMRLAPSYMPGQVALGNFYAKRANWLAAQAEFERVLNWNPKLPEAHVGLAGVFSATGRDEKIVAHLQEAIRLAPNWAEPANNLAWRLATHPNAGQRNGPEALRLARRAVELTKTNDFEILDTLAAAQAENGDFNAAQTTLRLALDLALKARQTNQLSSLSNRLVLYENRQPCCGP